MKTCPFCAEEIRDAAIKCKHCGSFLVPLASEPQRPSLQTQTHSEQRASLPGSVLASGILMFLWALIMLVVALLQVGLGVVSSSGETLATSGWNLMIVAVYVILGVGILKRTKWGYDWGLGSNVLNCVWGIVQVVKDQALSLAILIPIEIVIVVLLLTSKKHFISQATVPVAHAGEVGVRAAATAPVPPPTGGTKREDKGGPP